MVYILCWGAVLLASGSAVFALCWSLQRGQFDDLEEGAKVIFDDGEADAEDADQFPSDQSSKTDRLIR